MRFGCKTFWLGPYPCRACLSQMEGLLLLLQASSSPAAASNPHQRSQQPQAGRQPQGAAQVHALPPPCRCTKGSPRDLRSDESSQRQRASDSAPHHDALQHARPSQQPASCTPSAAEHSRLVCPFCDQPCQHLPARKPGLNGTRRLCKSHAWLSTGVICKLHQLRVTYTLSAARRPSPPPSLHTGPKVFSVQALTLHISPSEHVQQHDLCMSRGS